ncbi:expressed unknown protein [Seminavis robusta]|uniref:Uncharacterized protein n=1 Tax=Seminavis robusta TaxID=568900 RepID=A0A9N8EQ57_9STRA|nr:expressed unknown protein [Seminavis robusta]|eukprot:Sro1579_g283720.1 n/a (599) ;mRNA; f:10079-11875
MVSTSERNGLVGLVVAVLVSFWGSSRIVRLVARDVLEIDIDNSLSQSSSWLLEDHMPEFEREFPFSMQQTPACASAMSNLTKLERLAFLAEQDWQKQEHHHNDNPKWHDWLEAPLSDPMKVAEKEWSSILNACHGPWPDSTVDPAFAANYTLRAFWQGLRRCGAKEEQRGGHPAGFGGEWCMQGWRSRATRAFVENKRQPETGRLKRDPKADIFILTARCALKMEFPIVPQHQNNDKKDKDSSLQTTQRLTNRQKFPGWRPKRVILLSATLGKGATMGCKLVNTAFFRGWEVVFIEGKYRGIKHKYTDALAALQLLVSHSDIPAEETLVVFADSMDTLVQQSPDYVIESFLNMTRTFAFSAEPGCFPLATWPHSLGVPYHTCDKNFPLSQNRYQHAMIDQYGGAIHGYINTGGWIGLASSAFVVLTELSSVILREGQDQPCHDHGTDQLLGNAAFVRDPSLIGVDSDYAIIGSNAWELLEGSHLTLGPIPFYKDSQNKAYCNASLTAPEYAASCPAFLHFNGRGSSGGKIDEAFEELISDDSLGSCCRGRLLIAHVGKGKLWTESFEENKRWAKCRKENACLGKTTKDWGGICPKGIP